MVNSPKLPFSLAISDFVKDPPKSRISKFDHLRSNNHGDLRVFHGFFPFSQRETLPKRAPGSCRIPRPPRSSAPRPSPTCTRPQPSPWVPDRDGESQSLFSKDAPITWSNGGRLEKNGRNLRDFSRLPWIMLNYRKLKCSFFPGEKQDDEEFEKQTWCNIANLILLEIQGK